ncbi:hypothetical protein L228DRAFT_249629 [Xylona heveae TC161]|uniref:Uncharacterized protein n=1 Tax=Xylona heveae (strain CBS 132557 / TC161) TaxID=1328760 RepID=A0A165FC86_XYLHT|nr:hypothetical protein L228DRAFT_249629 [Xylona heveae TC161]KZF20814.1 hypothetical protein L228DRAFT_249629 [Xylona heveae TC161]
MAKDRPAEWDAAAEQLEHYLEGNRNGLGKGVYGAVAIGLRVQFYEFIPGRMQCISEKLTVTDRSGAEMIEQHLERMKCKAPGI